MGLFKDIRDIFKETRDDIKNSFSNDRKARESELELANDRLEIVENRINSVTEKTSKRFDKVVTNAYKLNRRINETTIKKACDITEKIKIENDNEFPAFPELNEFKEKINIDYVASYQLPSSETVHAINDALFGPLGGDLIDYLSHSRKMEKLQDEYREACIQEKKVKIECKKINHNLDLIEQNIATAKELDALTKEYEKRTTELFKSKGYSTLKWDKKDIETVKNMFNLVKLLFDITNQEIVTPKGNLKKKYKELTESVSNVDLSEYRLPESTK